MFTEIYGHAARALSDEEWEKLEEKNKKLDEKQEKLDEENEKLNDVVYEESVPNTNKNTSSPAINGSQGEVYICHIKSNTV